MNGLRLTQEQYADLLRKRAAQPVAAAPAHALKPAAPIEDRTAMSARAAKQRVQALGRMKRGEKNATERAYGETLEEEKRAGVIVWFEFEAVTLVLPGGVRYTPDYHVQLASGEMEFREVKGYWQDDARVKIRLAAGCFPMYRFIAIRKRAKKDGGGWEMEDFSK